MRLGSRAVIGLRCLDSGVRNGPLFDTGAYPNDSLLDTLLDIGPFSGASF